jgi:hypothetical protein
LRITKLINSAIYLQTRSLFVFLSFSEKIQTESIRNVKEDKKPLVEKIPQGVFAIIDKNLLQNGQLSDLQQINAVNINKISFIGFGKFAKPDFLFQYL